MNVIREKIERIVAWVRRPRNKKRIYAALVVMVVLWVIGRFAMIAVENRMVVFNPARAAAATGTPVQVMTAHQTTDMLHEPLTVKNNRAMVSGTRVGLLHAGQKIGDGVIVSVASGIDLDTGLHAVRTRGVADGLNYAQYSATGFFIPSYAITNNVVYVADGDTAVARNVHIARSDADTSVITSGLNDGDIVILSRVVDGQKIQIQK